MNWLKIITQGGGWVSIAAALITLILKQCGIEVEESAILPLLTVGGGAVGGARFIPTVPKGVPVMNSLHNQAIDAIHLLDGLFKSEAAQAAVGVLWNEARTVPKPEANNVS